MRRDTRYRLYFNNDPADRDLLEQVDSISVEQEVGMAVEAQLTIPVCLDRRGHWRHADAVFMQPDARVRVEIAVRGDHFVPLIDGPVVSLSTRLHFEPGSSAVTLTVRDDSVYLNKVEQHFSFDTENDYEIAEEILTTPEQISSVEIDPELRQRDEDAPPFRANGTAMQVLSNLAKVHNGYVYVLPGETPGRSIGCCRPLPVPGEQEEDPLPTMVLLGAGANIRELDVTRNLQRPGNYSGSTVQISDKSIVTGSADFRDAGVMGDSGALPEGQSGAVRLFRSSPFEERNREGAIASQAESSSFAFEARSSVIAGCYPDILQPYRTVTVEAGDTPLSGNYIIKQVRHSLDRSSYNQAFTLMRNGETEPRTLLQAMPEEDIS